MHLERTLLSILLIMSLHPSSESGASGPESSTAGSNKLAPCPSSPNCISSLAEGGYHAIVPISYSGSSEDVLDQLKNIVEKMKRTRLVTASVGYLHAEFRTFLGFVDDVELYVDQEKHLVHIRSASRVGYWDFGVNRRRLESIKAEFERLRSQHDQDQADHGS